MHIYTILFYIYDNFDISCLNEKIILIMINDELQPFFSKNFINHVLQKKVL